MRGGRCTSPCMIKGLMYVKPISSQCSIFAETRWLVLISKLCEKQMWKSDMLSKDGGYFLLVKANYLIFP